MRALQRTLASSHWPSLQRRGLLLAHLVPIALAAEHSDIARGAMHELQRHPELWQTPALAAAVAEARAALFRHEGDLAPAVVALREAVRLWQEVSSPLAVGRARIRLADALLAQGDADGAELELHAASRLVSGRGAEPLEAEIQRVRALLRD